MLTWAADDWKAKGKPGKPNCSSTGGNPHPYPNAPKAAGEAIAAELGFELLPPIVFVLTPGDYSAQCLTLKSSGANYASFLGNTAGSNISVKAGLEWLAGVEAQFLGNVWGMDENAAKAAGAAADGVVFPLRTAVAWAATRMKTFMEISKMSDVAGTAYRPYHLCRAAAPRST